MIQITILLPLAISGIAAAVWREHRQRRLRQITENHQPMGTAELLPPPTLQLAIKPVFDDCVEIDHYQRISLYSLALSLPATWFFYGPVIWICIPLISYSSYCLGKTIHYSSHKTRRSALTVFECAVLAGSLFTGRLVMGSMSLALSFGIRKMLLQAGNIAHLGFYEAMKQQPVKVWVLRHGVEIESTLSDISEDDRVIVRAGEPIMIEGIVCAGKGIVRQFSLLNTIKSISKQKGNKVFPFTQLESGRLLLRKC